MSKNALYLMTFKPVRFYRTSSKLKTQVIMAQLTGLNDKQFAAGAAIGGAASLMGPTAVGAAKVAAVKLGALGALKTGIGVGLAVNPIFAGIALVGGAGYLIYKACR